MTLEEHKKKILDALDLELLTNPYNDIVWLTGDAKRLVSDFVSQAIDSTAEETYKAVKPEPEDNPVNIEHPQFETFEREWEIREGVVGEVESKWKEFKS